MKLAYNVYDIGGFVEGAHPNLVRKAIATGALIARQMGDTEIVLQKDLTTWLESLPIVNPPSAMTKPVLVG